TATATILEEVITAGTPFLTSPLKPGVSAKLNNKANNSLLAPTPQLLMLKALPLQRFICQRRYRVSPRRPLTSNNDSLSILEAAITSAMIAASSKFYTTLLLLQLILEPDLLLLS
ncbi:hypothetical protein Alg130_12327, partial [Pyrenophora tritici-repentis]